MWSTKMQIVAGAKLGFLALFALFSSACGPPPADPALESYQRLLRAVQVGSAQGVWTSLSPASQRELLARVGEAVGGEAQQAKVGGPPAQLGVRPGWQFELDLPSSAQLESATLTEERRFVVGPLGGQMWRIPVIKVEEHWRVDLFSATPVQGEEEPKG